MNKSLAELLSCPKCGKGVSGLQLSEDALSCCECGSRYGISKERPVLIDPGSGVFDVSVYLDCPDVVVSTKKGWFTPSVNLVRDAAMRRMISLLAKEHEGSAIKVLIVGSGTQRETIDSMFSGLSAEIVYTDVDIRADVDVFCDAHQLPFIDSSFDCVITTAVLEHVLYPEIVAKEIARVLTLGGILYSELPFMQQVHEGAYDFTRYTLSGHRRLFHQFEAIETGMVAGPGTVLVWSIENFLMAFFSSSLLRAGAKCGGRLLFGWIKYFDYLLQKRPYAIDGASCTLFVGRKSSKLTSDVQIIESYGGGKELSHTS